MVFTDRDFKVFTDRDFKVFTDRDFKVFTDHTLLLWRSCEVPKTGTELATMLGLDPAFQLGSTHFCMGTVSQHQLWYQVLNQGLASRHESPAIVPYNAGL